MYLKSLNWMTLHDWMLSTTSNMTIFMPSISLFVKVVHYYYNLSITMQMKLVIHWTGFPCVWIIMGKRHFCACVFRSLTITSTSKPFLIAVSLTSPQFFDATDREIQQLTFKYLLCWFALFSLSTVYFFLLLNTKRSLPKVAS